ncbi:hypothetical protein [Nocardia sp. NBC_01009]|nr:hypothetical protein OHA42_14065 [Nocardia sp. NBC_01009]
MVVFFYNPRRGRARTARIDADGKCVNMVDFPAGRFGHWSSIVA